MNESIAKERVNSPRSATSLHGLLSRSLGQGAIAAGLPDPAITDVCIDSRRVSPGALFVAIPGTKADGAAFVPDALARGAAALIVDQNADVQVARASLPAAAAPVVVRVADPRRAASRLAAVLTGLDAIQRAGGLKVVGVTGTNGKSTTTYMIRSILRAAGHPAALLGTIEYDLVSRRLSSELTTPDPVALARHLVEAHDAGARHAVMEVSSHSLDQRRVDGIAFSVSVFTNLTQDHLDYHATLDEYLKAKRLLFESLDAEGVAAINIDDPAAEKIATGCRARVIRYGIGGRADCRATIRSEQLTGSRITLDYDHYALDIALRLAGRYNVQNALAAASAAFGLGIASEAIIKGLESLTGVPGRLQSVNTGDAGFGLFVDYAHTDDALRNVLGCVRKLTTGQLWCVFGCGGDRDRTKRPKMARAVAECADRFIVTSDNPRTEDPLKIIADIEAGLTAGDRKRSETIADRAAAIGRAIEQLRPGDALVIAGKGHEDYQIIGTTKIHFDDAEVAAEAIARRRKQAP